MSELERMGLKQAVSAATRCGAEAETRDKKRSEADVGHSGGDSAVATGMGAEEAGGGVRESGGHDAASRPGHVSSNDKSLAAIGVATDVLDASMTAIT